MKTEILKKIKGSSIKIALLGLAGLSLANAINPTLSNLEIAQEIRNSTEYVQVVDAKFSVVNDMYNHMKKDGLLDNFEHEVKMRVSEDSSSAFQKFDLNSGTYSCEVKMNVDGKTGLIDMTEATSFKGLLTGVSGMNTNMSDDVMYTEFVLAHEFGHCDFAKIDAPFQLTGDLTNNALLNEVYGNTGVRIEVNYGEGISNIYGMEYHLNEAYAESFATIAMIKAHNGSPEVQNFLKKQEIIRDFETSVTSPNLYTVDGYDIGDSISSLNTPDKIQQILNASPEELKSIALETANSTFLKGLTRASEEAFEYSISTDLLVEQGMKMASFYTPQVYVTQKDSGFTDIFKNAAQENNLSVNEVVNVFELSKEAQKDVIEKVRNIQISIQNDIYSGDFTVKAEAAADLLRDLRSENKEDVGAKMTGEMVIDEMGESLGLSMKDLKVVKKEFEQRKAHRDRIIATEKTMHDLKTAKPY